jgi:hypothetical protein
MCSFAQVTFRDDWSGILFAGRPAKNALRATLASVPNFSW